MLKALKCLSYREPLIFILQEEGKKKMKHFRLIDAIIACMIAAVFGALKLLAGKSGKSLVVVQLVENWKTQNITCRALENVLSSGLTNVGRFLSEEMWR